MNSSPISPSPPALLEQGDPAEDGRAFRRCLGQYPTGVCVVTAQHGSNLLGMAVNSFAAVSLAPPLVLWSIRRESSSAAGFCAAGHFAVNMLSAEQVHLAQQFGSPAGERFAGVAWQPGRSGAPLLAGATAQLECRLVQVHEGGDHFILVGHVERYARFEGDPLVFSRGRYGVAQDHPQLARSAEQAAATPPANAQAEPSFLRHLSLAGQHMNLQFEAHRRDLGVTAAAARVLNQLQAGALDKAALQRATLLGQSAVEDALGELSHQGLVRSQTEPFQLTPAGQDRRAALAARVAEFTRAQLQGLPQADVAAAARVLQALAQH